MNVLSRFVRALAAVVALSACSGPAEDVRMGFCKELTVEMLGKPQSIDWTASSINAERLGDLVVRLDYVATRAGSEANKGWVTCTYEQDEGSDFTMGDANPLEAYKTLPYYVGLNGRSLSDQRLNATTQATLLNKARVFSEAFEEQARKVADEVSRGMHDLSKELDKALNP